MPTPTEKYGIVWPNFVTQYALDTWRDYNLRDDDVIIATYPKSGTNWVREIVTLINVSGNVEAIDRSQLSPPIEFIHGPAEKSKDGPPIIDKAKSWTSPRVLETHVVEKCLPIQLKEGKGKAIYVIRNPKDVAVSYWNFDNNLPHNTKVDWKEFFNEYIDGKRAYGHWYNHVKQYWQRHKKSNNFLFLYYEDLKKDHRGGVVQIAKFLGRTLSEEIIEKIVEHSSFTGMTKTHNLAKDFLQKNEDSLMPNNSEEQKIGPPSLLRKGMVGDWKNHFTVSQNELIDSIYKKEMEGSGIKIEYD